MNTPEFLTSNCLWNVSLCRSLNCAEAAKENPNTGRWFITMGHAGFNSKANNRDGYASEKRARLAMANCLRK
jgi:hypothetical protein